jgi:hypothetical protein
VLQNNSTTLCKCTGSRYHFLFTRSLQNIAIFHSAGKGTTAQNTTTHHKLCKLSASRQDSCPDSGGTMPEQHRSPAIPTQRSPGALKNDISQDTKNRFPSHNSRPNTHHSAPPSSLSPFSPFLRLRQSVYLNAKYLGMLPLPLCFPNPTNAQNPLYTLFHRTISPPIRTTGGQLNRSPQCSPCCSGSVAATVVAQHTRRSGNDPRRELVNNQT